MEACCVKAEYRLCISVQLLQFTIVVKPLTLSNFVLFSACLVLN